MTAFLDLLAFTAAKLSPLVDCARLQSTRQTDFLKKEASTDGFLPADSLEEAILCVRGLIVGEIPRFAGRVDPAGELAGIRVFDGWRDESKEAP